MSTNSNTTIEGYPRLAKLMGPRNLGIFRKFSELNALNILQHQAELVYLEQELKILVELDHTSGHPTRTLHAKSAYALRKSVGSGSDQQWKKVLEIREKLKEYNAVVLQQAELNRLKPAKRNELELLRKWLLRPEGGNDFLKDIEGDPWDDENEGDLISVNDEQEFDVFTGWTAEKLTPWLYRLVSHRWKKPIKGHEDVGLVEWKDDHFLVLAKTTSVIVSIIFPSTAVLVLYFIEKLLVRVGVVILFSALFSTSLAVFTNAKPVEIFAANAAFASVQVVFVGSTSTIS